VSRTGSELVASEVELLVLVASVAVDVVEAASQTAVAAGATFRDGRSGFYLLADQSENDTPAVKAFLTTNADISRRPAGPSPRTRGREGSGHSLAQAAQVAPRAHAIAQPISAQRPIPIGSNGTTHHA
jgi:hypothetical protein